MILYEIHQYRAGKWHLDSVYDKTNPARNRVVYRGGDVTLKREAGKAEEPHISVGQIVLLVTVGVTALGVWIYLQLT